MKQRYAKWVINYKGVEITSENYGDAMYDRGFSFSEDEKDAIMAIHDEIKNAWEDVVFGGEKWENVTPQAIKNAVQAWVESGEAKQEILDKIEIVQAC